MKSIREVRSAFALTAAVVVLVLVPARIAVGKRPGNVEHFNSGKILPTNLPFSEAVRVDSLVLLSGQIGIVPGTRNLVTGGIRDEARQTMSNIKSALEANGFGLRDVVKCTVMLADMSEWDAFNEVYRTFFTAPYPARSAFGANGLALGARVEVECVAAVPR
jgi:2-iminobutanoate/2-iminopropanoate deaminase